MELYRENLRNLPVPNHKAYGYQILHVALSSGPSPRHVNYNPRVELIAKGYKFYIGLYSEILRTMATNFSPCKGSYVLNQFPSNVMFGMNGFHVSASGAIQGHHGPLVIFLYARRRRDVLWDHPWQPGGHISKIILARVMKFHGWIDLTEGECSAQEP